MAKVIQGEIQAKGFKFGIIVSRFNDFISNRLLEGALDALMKHGARDADIEVVKVPGSFEIPFIAKKMALAKKYDAIVCLGAVIRGGTPHFEYISSEAAKGIATTALESGIPVIFGVITTDNIEQAIERAGAKNNKGWDAAMTAMEMVSLMKNLPLKK
ncbi:MAG: 6,7-dimethyl-8-ribityllumazine synthase [Nitrospirota bacterium]